ncbi:MAG: phosphatase PAP2 family protein [Phycisphaerae bacterium]
MRTLVACLLLTSTVILAVGCSDPSQDDLKLAINVHQNQHTLTGEQLAVADDSSQQSIQTDIGKITPTWLAMSDVLRADALVHLQRDGMIHFAGEPTTQDATGQAAAQPGDDLPYEPWQTRRGPAYPDDFWLSLGRDAKELPYTLWDDTKAIFKHKTALVLLAAAGVSAVMIDEKPDHQVEKHFEKHSTLSKFWDQVGDVGGNPGLHFAIAGAMYAYGSIEDDRETYELSKSLINALSITGALTLSLKYATQRESPNGDEIGWPSGHTSSSFCLAAVMYEHYGPTVGVPLYAFAAFVGYERLDARNHDFSDVVAGALIGMAIGHAVANNHEPKVMGMSVIPYTDPQRRSVGIALYKRF